MSEYITPKEVGERLGVPQAQVRELFSLGNYLEMVPRRRAPNGNLIVYRKDFEAALKKRAEDEKDYKKSSVLLWDSFFLETSAFSLSD